MSGSRGIEWLKKNPISQLLAFAWSTGYRRTVQICKDGSSALNEQLPDSPQLIQIDYLWRTPKRLLGCFLLETILSSPEPSVDYQPRS